MLNEKNKKKILDKIAKKQEELRNEKDDRKADAISKKISNLENKLDKKIEDFLDESKHIRYQRTAEGAQKRLDFIENDILPFVEEKYNDNIKEEYKNYQGSWRYDPSSEEYFELIKRENSMKARNDGRNKADRYLRLCNKADEESDSLKRYIDKEKNAVSIKDRLRELISRGLKNVGTDEEKK